MSALGLVVSLGMVTLGAEALVRGSSTLALRFGLSPLFVGLVVVGFGTSTPELGASLVASLRGSSDVSVGNVVGSNLFNIGVILAITALVRPIRVRIGAIRRDVGVALGAACLPWLALAAGGRIPRGVGVAMVGLLVIYVVAALRGGRSSPEPDRRLVADELRASAIVARPRTLPDRTWFNGVLIVAGLALLGFGSRMFVESALHLARSRGIPEIVLGLTIVSAGTSLPELVTSLVAVRRKSMDIAVGNVLGSNIFNGLGILGVSAVVTPQVVNPQILARDTPILLLATAALVPLIRTGGVISRVEGALVLAAYGIYLAVLILGPTA